MTPETEAKMNGLELLRHGTRTKLLRRRRRRYRKIFTIDEVEQLANLKTPTEQENTE